MPKYAEMRVIATIVVQTWTIPPMITVRHERSSFWNENSRPIVKRSSTIPIVPKVSMASWLVMSLNPYGPTSMPMIRKVTMLGILRRWPIYRRAIASVRILTLASSRSIREFSGFNGEPI